MGLGKSLRCNCDCWANGGGEQRSALSISCCFCFVESLQKTSTWRKKIHKKKRRSTNYGTNRKQIHKSQQKTRVATRHCCSLRRLHTAATPWGDRHGSRGSRSMCRAESRTIDWDVATRQSPCHEVKREKHRKNRKKSWRSFSFLFVGSLEAKQNKIWQLNINWMYIMYIRSTFPKCSSVINALELGRWSWWDLSTWLALMATCDGFVFKQRRLPEFGGLPPGGRTWKSRFQTSETLHSDWPFAGGSANATLGDPSCSCLEFCESEFNCRACCDCHDVLLPRHQCSLRSCSIVSRRFLFWAANLKYRGWMLMSTGSGASGRIPANSSITGSGAAITLWLFWGL